MPVVKVEWLSGRSQAQKEAVAEGFTEVMSREAGVSPDGIQILFVNVERTDWAIGGRFQS